LSGFLSGAGLLLAAGGASASVLLAPGRARSAAMLGALILFPVLILGDQWHSGPIVELRHHEAKAAVAIVLGAVLVAALAWLFRSRPLLLPLAIIGLLPFRIPLESGGETANLLVPLYVVIAAGVLATVVSPPRWERRAPRWQAKLLATFVLLYALQALYS
jgi:putative inorganic carbon (HCO3(-)) transporter